MVLLFPIAFNLDKAKDCQIAKDWNNIKLCIHLQDLPTSSEISVPGNSARISAFSCLTEGHSLKLPVKKNKAIHEKFILDLYHKTKYTLYHIIHTLNDLSIASF